MKRLGLSYVKKKKKLYCTALKEIVRWRVILVVIIQRPERLFTLKYQYQQSIK